jgi:hypothetical protein
VTGESLAALARSRCLGDARTGKNRVRRKTDFVNRFRLIGCSALPARKISLYENQK